jgi:hypothetical protein
VPEQSLLFTASWRSDLNTGSAGYKRYAPLAPGPWFRDPIPDRDWVAKYESEVLAHLDARAVVRDLMALAGGQPVLLMCWEPPPPDLAWCHRALVSRWLSREVGMSAPEYGCEHLGHGYDHPKLPSYLLRRGD